MKIVKKKEEKIAYNINIIKNKNKSILKQKNYTDTFILYTYMCLIKLVM